MPEHLASNRRLLLMLALDKKSLAEADLLSKLVTSGCLAAVAARGAVLRPSVA